jgi:signal peptidase I
MSAHIAEPQADASETAERTGRSRWSRIGGVLNTVGLILVFTIAGLMVVPSVLGYDRYVIVSGSMEPTIGTGSVVYDKPVPVEDLEVGDIITFVPPPEFDHDLPVTHRIYEISTTAPGTEVDGKTVPAGTRQFRTKGDANEDPDPWKMVLDQPEQARVEHHIEYLGYIYGFLSNRWAQLLLIGLPALLIGIVLIRALWREAGESVRRERTKAAAS